LQDDHEVAVYVVIQMASPIQLKTYYCLTTACN
jgi:hypothetical protein